MKQGHPSLRCIIIDDKHEALDLHEQLLTDSGHFEVLGKVSDPMEITDVVKGKSPDVVFVDIKMPVISGLQLLKLLKPIYSDTKYVFVTAYHDKIQDAIWLSAFDFLVKPVLKNDLIKLAQRLRNEGNIKNKIENDKIKIPIKQGAIFLSPDEIMCLMASGNYTKIILNRNVPSIISSYNVGKYHVLLEDKGFARISRNALINKTYLYKYNRNKNRLTLNSKEKQIELPYSQSYFKSVL